MPHISPALAAEVPTSASSHRLCRGPACRAREVIVVKPTKAVRGMKRQNRLSAMLAGGDRRSIGAADSVAALVLAEPQRFKELLLCLWNDDPVIRMRAADALEKISRAAPELLHPHKAEILGLADESQQIELQWHLAQMFSRLKLTATERRRAVARLTEYLQSRSSIVKTFALQGLYELARQDDQLQSEVAELLEEALRHGTAAMKARARSLLRDAIGAAPSRH